MIKFLLETSVNGTPTQDFTKIVDVYDKYFEKLGKKLDEIGDIVVAGIKENIDIGLSPPVKRKTGGVPLKNTGTHIYNEIKKHRINGNEVDVTIDGIGNEIGSYQQTGNYGKYGGGIARNFWNINQSTEDKIESLLQQIISDVKL